MNIEVIAPGVLEIKGFIKSITHFEVIETALNKQLAEGQKSIILKIPESFSITSSVIGLLYKLIREDGVEIHIEAYDRRLYRILENLNLIDEFRVKLVA